MIVDKCQKKTFVTEMVDQDHIQLTLSHFEAAVLMKVLGKMVIHNKGDAETAAKAIYTKLFPLLSDEHYGNGIDIVFLANSGYELKGGTSCL